MEIKPIFTPEDIDKLNEVLTPMIKKTFETLSHNIQQLAEALYIPEIDSSKISVTNAEGEKVAEYEDTADEGCSVAPEEHIGYAPINGDTMASEYAERHEGHVHTKPFGPGRCSSQKSEDFQISGNMASEYFEEVFNKGTSCAKPIEDVFNHGMINPDPVKIPVRFTNDAGHAWISSWPVYGDGMIHISERELQQLIGTTNKASLMHREGYNEGVRWMRKEARAQALAVQKELERMIEDIDRELERVLTLEDRTARTSSRTSLAVAARLVYKMIEGIMSDVR